MGEGPSICVEKVMNPFTVWKCTRRTDVGCTLQIVFEPGPLMPGCPCVQRWLCFSGDGCCAICWLKFTPPGLLNSTDEESCAEDIIRCIRGTRVSPPCSSLL